jgi:hypothetical protein
LARAALLDANLASAGCWRLGVVAIKTKSLEPGLTKRGDRPMRKAGNGEGSSEEIYNAATRSISDGDGFWHYRKSYGI